MPDFKLDKSVVQRRVDILEAEGIEFRTGVEVGVDVDARELRERFDAIVIATGSTVPRDLPVPGRELDGVHFAMEYLEQRNRFVAGDAAPRAADQRRRQARGDHRRRRHRRRLPRQLAPRAAAERHPVRAAARAGARSARTT